MSDALTQPITPSIVARVRSWIINAKQPNTKIAGLAGVDEKTIRLAQTKVNWNPTADTLAKLEAVVPAGFGPEPKPTKQKKART